MNTLLRDILISMEDELKESNVTVRLEPVPPLFVSPVLIRQLFQNLINNAVKYRRKNVECTIRIYSQWNSEDKDCLILVVDNGIGFDQKYSEDIFSMLTKLHGNSEYPGSGIGLTLCRKIAELHHGFISARGEEQGGATFTVSLPVYREESLLVDVI